jgi:hypothetical protein
MLSSILRSQVLSNVAWLISPKIDMDTHTNEILTFRTAQHHLDVDSPLNSLEVFVSSNGLNVTKATWIPLKVILPKQATLVSVCGFWRCGPILQGKNQYRF